MYESGRSKPTTTHFKNKLQKRLPTRERKTKLSWFSFRIKTMLHGSTKKMIGRLIFFRSSGLAHWAIYRLLNLCTHSVILRVPLVKKKVLSTLLNNKQSVARLDMLGEWREAHGFGTWRWGTSGFDAAVLKHPIWLIRINKRAAARDSDDEVDVGVGRNLLRTPSTRLPSTTSPFTSPHRRLHPRRLHVHRWQNN